jgi:hypothetical protein
LQEIIADHSKLKIIKTKENNNDLFNETNFVKSSLPIHKKLFEKHRLKTLKLLLETTIKNELFYHCKVVEELSIVLHDLVKFDVDDDYNFEYFNSKLS